MTKHNQKKLNQLGMSHGTAVHKLRKSVMFMMAKKCDMDMCYRCGKKITNLKEFSLEHKEPWLDTNPKLFWDLDNIAFSHFVCNMRASRRNTPDCVAARKKPKECPSDTAYRNGCRCSRCKELQKSKMERLRARWIKDGRVHGYKTLQNREEVISQPSLG